MFLCLRVGALKAFVPGFPEWLRVWVQSLGDVCRV